MSQNQKPKLSFGPKEFGMKLREVAKNTASSKPISSYDFGRLSTLSEAPKRNRTEAVSPMSQAIKSVFDYARTRHVLVADESSSVRAGLMPLLRSLGFRAGYVHLASNMETAIVEIQMYRPEVIITDYDFMKSSGLELLKHQRLYLDVDQIETSTFMVLTYNESLQACGECADTSVDLMYAKPVRIDTLRKAVIDTILTKTNLDAFSSELKPLKTFIDAENLDKAIQSLKDLQKFELEETVAFVVERHSVRQKGSPIEKQTLPIAKQSKRVVYSKLYYQYCGELFDLCVKVGAPSKTYEIGTLLLPYLTTNENRFTDFLRALFQVGKESDLDHLYLIFKDIRTPSSKLSRAMASALYIYGKVHLSAGMTTGDFEKIQYAMSIFDYATKSAKEWLPIYQKVIFTLLETSREDLRIFAMSLFRNVPYALRQSHDYLVLELKLLDEVPTNNPLGQSQSEMVIAYGRKLLSKGIRDPLIYRILLSRYLQTGKDLWRETLVYQAIELFPNHKQEFLKFL